LKKIGLIFKVFQQKQVLRMSIFPGKSIKKIKQRNSNIWKLNFPEIPWLLKWFYKFY
jgi:hypothetical protein